MKIGIDIDGTIYDTEKYFRVMAEIYDIEKLHSKDGIVDRLAMWTNDRYNWTKEENDTFVNMFPELTEKCNLVPGAKEVIQRIQKLGVETIIISARGSDSPKIRNEDGNAMIETAMDKLEKDGLKFDKYIFRTEGKVDECQAEGIDFLIDDSPDVCEETSKAGIKTIFLKDSGVRDVEPNKNLFKVYNWGEIYRLIFNFVNNKK